jgi:hypothetical protein
MTDDPNSKTLTERVQYYRAMADEAMRSAEGVQSPLAREDFLKLARSWHALATQIESVIGFRIDPDANADDVTLHYSRRQRH